MLFAFLIFARPAFAQSDQAEQVILRSIEAHRLAQLARFKSALVQGELTLFRAGVPKSYPCTIKLALGEKLQRTEYQDEDGPVVFIKNGSFVWEARGRAVKQYKNRHPFLQESNLNPAFGVLSSLKAVESRREYSHQGLSIAGGRRAHRVTRSYRPFAGQWQGYEGSSEKLELFIDEASSLVLEVHHTLGSDYNRMVFRYGDYQDIGGQIVPKVVTHLFDDRKQWELRISSISLGQQVDFREFERP